jgi:3-deoxy-manno-octulosonate cytidylyltransferase (CMP-KDO synthetase)
VTPYLQGKLPDMTTLACPLDAKTGPNDPNVVKVLCDRHNQALYFSRAPIPYYRHAAPAPVFHHLGLYAFSRTFLAEYAKLEPTPLEQCEALEQLRVLEHGYRITVCRTQSLVPEINTPDDLLTAQSLITQLVA